jgi:hypothetical protein
MTVGFRSFSNVYEKRGVCSCGAVLRSGYYDQYDRTGVAMYDAASPLV